MKKIKPKDFLRMSREELSSHLKSAKTRSWEDVRRARHHRDGNDPDERMAQLDDEAREDILAQTPDEIRKEFGFTKADISDEEIEDLKARLSIRKN